MSLCFLSILFPANSQAESLKIATTPFAYNAYMAFIQEKGVSPLEVTDFISPNSNRLVVDLVLILQALSLGGLKAEVEFSLSQNYVRNIHEVKSGSLPILGQETWAEEFDDSVYKSIAIVQRGEFKKAVVCREGDFRLANAIQHGDFSKLTAVTGLGWNVDIRTLQEMNVGKIIESPKYSLHAKMIIAGRADFGLYEFDDIRTGAVILPMGLVSVSNTMVGLAGSRHFMVSRLHPQGKAVFEALDRGLGILRSRGVIQKALIQCGFLPKKNTGIHQIYP